MFKPREQNLNAFFSTKSSSRPTWSHFVGLGISDMKPLLRSTLFSCCQGLAQMRFALVCLFLSLFLSFLFFFFGGGGERKGTPPFLFGGGFPSLRHTQLLAVVWI